MSMKLNFFLFLLATTFALASRPSAACSAQFQAEGKAVPRALLKRGYDKFGPLSMSRLLRQIDSVEVVPGSDLIGKMDLRSTARWSRQGGHLKVQVDCAWYNKFPRKTRTILAFHEYLWSLGIYDEIYWVSLGGWLLTEPLAHEALHKEEIGKLQTWMTKIAAKSGGVVGVGGGGEIQTIECRISPIIKALMRIKAAKTPQERELGLALFEDNLTRDLNCLSGSRLDNMR